MSASANQGAIRLKGNLSIGVITSEFYARFGNQYDALVVQSILLAALRAIPGSHSKHVSDTTSADITAIVQFQNITPPLIHRLVINVNSPAAVAAATVKDFLPITTFLVVCGIFMPTDSLFQLHRLWDYIKLGNSLRNLLPAQLIEVFLHSLTNIYGTAVSTAASASLPLPPSLFCSLVKAAVDTPTELTNYLQQCYLETVRLRETATLVELASQRAEIAKLTKLVSNLSSKPSRASSDPPFSLSPSPKLVLPCFKWLNRLSCTRDCGFYHAWPSHVSSAEKDAFLLRAKATSSSPNPSPRPSSTTPRATTRSASRPSSSARPVPPVDPIPLDI